MITKMASQSSGIDAAPDELSIIVRVLLAANQTLAVGTPICRDITKLPGGLLPRDQQPSQLFFNARFGDIGVLATSGNAGDVIGVYQGEVGQGKPFTNTSGASAYHSTPVRIRGMGKVLAGAVAAGTAVTVGSKLIVSSSNVFATVGTRAIGTAVGVTTAYAVNTTVATALASTGSQTVTPASMFGIISGSVLTIDNGTSQEVVTVTAVAATTFTATFAQTHGANYSVQGITATSGNNVIVVPGSGSTSGIVYADINTLA